MPTDIIYLDNNATTPLDGRVLEAMMPFFTTEFANAASNHEFGIRVNQHVKYARENVASLIGAEPNEIIFTSGATEAINLAIKGIAENYKEKGKHIVTVATEHSAVLDTCKYLETVGYEVTYLPVQQDGLLDLDIVKNSIRPDTILVSVMFVNNETGVIQPIKEIAVLSHAQGAFFMTDATQAVGKIPIDVNDIGIDLLCLSGHKFYGPKGIGVLFIKNKIKLSPLLHGGGHERGLRSGTLNVPAIVGLGKASLIAYNEMLVDSTYIQNLRNHLENKLLETGDAFVNGNIAHRLFNTVNICFRGIDADTIIKSLRRIAVSNGSACTSTVIEASHVLKAMKLRDEDAFSSIRFSIGKHNNKEEIDIVLDEITKSIKTLN